MFGLKSYLIQPEVWLKQKLWTEILKSWAYGKMNYSTVIEKDGGN